MKPSPATRRVTASMLFACAFLGIAFISATAQQQFSTDAYQRFMKEAASFTPQDLLRTYPTGSLRTNAGVSGSTPEWFTADYASQIKARYNLTTDENALLQKHNFMVTERLNYKSFGDAFLEIWHSDLPVFVSADAILQAMHASYRTILPAVETSYLVPKFAAMLLALHKTLPALEKKYAAQPIMLTMLRDVDVYLTIPLMALDPTIKPYFAQDTGIVAAINKAITALKPANIILFSANGRDYDFSQFQVRGHYTQSAYLQNYFRAMMWIGRTELYLTKPTSVTETPQQFRDIQRQIIDAALIVEAFAVADSAAKTSETKATRLQQDFDSMINSLVGESDNVQVSQMREVLRTNNITNASQLLDSLTTRRFQDTLVRKPFAEQRINSQILFGTATGTANFIKPAASFMLSGQRFIIDSYLTGNVVHDKVPFRMLPSMQDVLFGLGNNASAQILQPELVKYQSKGYIAALASMRYLVDGYDDAYWGETLHSLWLNCIRKLNPPQDRTKLPAFMQTGAFWQEKMNTQLASWAELRHGNVLYAKQSYSGAIPGCSFPNGYVEPIPEFYAAVRRFAEKASVIFSQVPVTGNTNYTQYFSTMQSIAQTLETLAQKELRDEAFTESEKRFLKQIVTRQVISAGCATVTVYDGWYFQLFFGDLANLFKKDYVAVDVHTAPTDEFGNPTGWVQHVGVGAVNMAVVVAPVAGGCPIAFAGPVMSYYEHLTTNFQRLTDEDWVKLYDQMPPARPSWVNIYLADKQGKMRPPSSLNLITSVGGQIAMNNAANDVRIVPYPNPSPGEVMLQAQVPERLAGKMADIAIYSATGREVARLGKQYLPFGTVLLPWNGVDFAGSPVASGTYYCVISIAGEKQRAALVIRR